MSYIVKVKNNSLVSKNWGGQAYSVGEERIVTKLAVYQEDDIFFADVGTGDAQIGDATEYFTAADGWNYLLGDTPRKIEVIKDKPFKDAQGFRARMKGFMGTAIKGTVTNIDCQIAEERFLNGVNLVLNNHEYGDNICFQVVDKDRLYAGILYPVEVPGEVILDEFGCNWYVSADKQDQDQIIVPYPARIYSGLYIRIVYNSIGTQNDIGVAINLYLHKKE